MWKVCAYRVRERLVQKVSEMWKWQVGSCEEMYEDQTMTVTIQNKLHKESRRACSFLADCEPQYRKVENQL